MLSIFIKNWEMKQRSGMHLNAASSSSKRRRRRQHHSSKLQRRRQGFNFPKD
jgi:hypothetical protein